MVIFGLLHALSCIIEMHNSTIIYIISTMMWICVGESVGAGESVVQRTPAAGRAEEKAL